MSYGKYHSNAFGTHKCASFHIITHYLVYISQHTYSRYNEIYFKCFNIFVEYIIIFHLNILMKHYLVLTCYAILQKQFFSQVDIVDTIQHKQCKCRPPHPPQPDNCLYITHIIGQVSHHQKLNLQLCYTDLYSDIMICKYIQ